MWSNRSVYCSQRNLEMINNSSRNFVAIISTIDTMRSVFSELKNGPCHYYLKLLLRCDYATCKISSEQFAWTN
ncbi:50S ribosomal protein L18 domain protein [Trichuris suis]|nr:50S ribosomal protein L18 domain protein [Trichuris suis]